MANLSLGKIFTAIFIIIALLLVAQPMLQDVFSTPGTYYTNSASYQQIQSIIALYSTSNQTITPYNNTNGTVSGYSSNTAIGKILSLTYINATAPGGGFVAPILNSFTGAAFVFSTIGQIMAVMLTLGAVASSIIGSIFALLPPMVSQIIANVLRLFAAYIMLRVLMLFIGTWSKFDLWSS